MIRSLYLSPEGQIQSGLSQNQICDAVQSGRSSLWVDIVEEPAATAEQFLNEVFHFHPLAISDALQEIHIPKVDDWDEYLYLVLHCLTFDNLKDDLVGSLEADFFLGKNYLVTYQEQHIHEMDLVWQNCQRDPRHLKRGAVEILYLIADEFTEGYTQAIEEIEDDIDSVEDEIFGVSKPNTLQRLFGLKRALLRLRRSITPQRDVLNRLARNDYLMIDAQYKVFFRDVYDHLLRLNEVNDSMRELVSEALSSYLSMVNNRLNDVMKTLTIITTLFMPISFLTGFFGMNFFQPAIHLDMWTGRVAFILILLLIIGTPLGMYIWVKKQRWM